ncbi:putative monooxygenase [Lentinula aff. lateritia]|uniref:Monooxygenase n=1 Tax=Lentinula aff. lateritia TaxID=2804960 RepID=A0ACC1TJI8_9AGAR|nr:putative monooxygenase [Lentinula aff. lateritia]
MTAVAPLHLHSFAPGPLVIAIGGLAAFAIFRVFFSGGSKLPPGPSRIPVFGNAFGLPADCAWIKLSQWALQYGIIMYLEVLKQPMVVLSSIKIANDLLNKRSALYSDRPNLVRIVVFICRSGYGKTLPISHYGDKWRAQRKMVAQEFGPGAVTKFQTMQELQARKLMQTVLSNPKQLANEVKLCIGSIILRATYGYWLTGSQDPFLLLPLQAMENFSQAATPGTWLVDVIPILKHIPSWLPGAAFLQTAKEWTKTTIQATQEIYNWSKEEIIKGTSLEPNICASIFTQHDGQLSGTDEESLMWGTSSVMGGGMDTNMSTIMSFFMLMILFPEIQQKAQQELSTVTGDLRLPNLSDKSDLPYIRGLITEVYRLFPAVPLGIPHCLIQDDVYNGMLLPKGTVVIANVWHMMHDPVQFPDPEIFNPERYMGSDTEMQKVTDVVFGFGRRRCPGYDFSQQTIYSIILTALATCNILPQVTPAGDPIIPLPSYTSGAIT